MTQFSDEAFCVEECANADFFLEVVRLSNDGRNLQQIDTNFRGAIVRRTLGAAIGTAKRAWISQRIA